MYAIPMAIVALGCQGGGADDAGRTCAGATSVIDRLHPPSPLVVDTLASKHFLGAREWCENAAGLKALATRGDAAFSGLPAPREAKA